MPGQGQKGLTFADKEKATQMLNDKVTLFCEALEKKDDKNPDQSMLEEFFTVQDLNTLFKRVEAKLGKKLADVAEAWATLQTLKGEKKKTERSSTLFKFLADQEGDDWVEYMCQVSDEVTRQADHVKEKDIV